MDELLVKYGKEKPQTELQAEVDRLKEKQ